MESLTEQLGEAIWAQIQQTEGEGGILEQLKSGKAQEAVAQVLKSRYQKLATRADRAVGCNMYANMLEQPLGKNGRSPEELVQMRALALKEALAGQNTEDCRARAGASARPRQRRPEEFIPAVAAAFSAGATLQQVRHALNDSFEGDVTVVPIPEARWTEPFENLRRTTEQYEKETGQNRQHLPGQHGPDSPAQGPCRLHHRLYGGRSLQGSGQQRLPHRGGGGQAAIEAPAR